MTTDTASSPDILQHTEAGVLTLTLHRVDKKNALTQPMYATLAQSLHTAAADPTVRVVVLQGDPNVFCAGHDMADFLTRSQATAPQEDTLLNGPTFAFLHALADFPKPLLAAVAGPAVGVGATMLLHCDVVYAGDNAALSFPFINLGLCPEAASSLLLPHLMGYHRAAEALLLGTPLMAEAALEAGLVSRIVPPAEVNALAQQQARRLADKPLAALMETKRLLKSGMASAVKARMAEEGRSFARLLTSPAAQECLAAFMDKRTSHPRES